MKNRNSLGRKVTYMKTLLAGGKQLDPTQEIRGTLLFTREGYIHVPRQITRQIFGAGTNFPVYGRLTLVNTLQLTANGSYSNTSVVMGRVQSDGTLRIHHRKLKTFQLQESVITDSFFTSSVTLFTRSHPISGEMSLYIS